MRARLHHLLWCTVLFGACTQHQDAEAQPPIDAPDTAAWHVVLQEAFEAMPLGEIPSGFSPGHTGKGTPGVWQVSADATRVGGEHVVMQTDPDRTNYRFPSLTHEGVSEKDVDVAVQFRPISGRVDQAAGLVWRYQDADNYYVVRANALENNVVLYKVQNGKRSDLPVVGRGRSYGVDADVPGGAWSELRVIAIDDTFTVVLNDQTLYQVRDTTFPDAGRVGLWTKADSVTAFDDLVVRVPPE